MKAKKPFDEDMFECPKCGYKAWLKIKKTKTKGFRVRETSSSIKFNKEFHKLK